MEELSISLAFGIVALAVYCLYVRGNNKGLHRMLSGRDKYIEKLVGEAKAAKEQLMPEQQAHGQTKALLKTALTRNAELADDNVWLHEKISRIQTVLSPPKTHVFDEKPDDPPST